MNENQQYPAEITAIFTYPVDFSPQSSSNGLFFRASLVSYLGVTDPVAYLQKAKNFHMAELIEKITDADCRKIYEHYNFACLKEVAK